MRGFISRQIWSTVVLTAAAVLMLWGCDTGLSRSEARRVLEESLVQSENRWSASSSCPSGLWYWDGRNHLENLEVTGVAEDDVEHRVSFTVSIRGLAEWTRGSGEAKLKRFDDGWRVDHAHIQTCGK
jgi:hypothetical protein